MGAPCMRFGLSALNRGCRLSSPIFRCLSSGSYPKHKRVGLPALSPTMDSGRISSFNKKAGDKLEPGDVIMTVETDKSCMDFEGTFEGYVACITDRTDSIDVGETILIVVDDEKDVAAFKDYKFDSALESKPKEEQKEQEQKEQEQKEQPTEKPSSERIKVSPSARRLIKMNNADINAIKGTGPKDRIVNADVIRELSSAQESKGPKIQKSQNDQKSQSKSEDYDVIPLSPFRLAVIKHLARSKPGIPDFSLTITAELDALLRLKDELNAQGTSKVTINDLVIKACANALKRVPELNSNFVDNEIRQFKVINVCVATATEAGLYMPVVPNVEKLGLSEISFKVKDLISKAKNGKLSPEEMSNGSFTVSNLGMFSIDQFNSIVSPPQVGILSVGTISKKVVKDAQGFKEVSCMNFTLTSDHRIVDGHIAAKWLKEFRSLIQNPISNLL